MTKEDRLKRLGARIREIRLSKNLTQRELGYRIDKDQQSIQRLESGLINPSFEYLYQLSVGLEMELFQILTFEINASQNQQS